MKTFFTLTALFLKQLVRRKALWVVFIVFAGMLLFNFMIKSSMEKALAEGESYDVVTRQATSQLESFAQTLKQSSIFMILMVSALVAPGSRRDGTTQFVLTLSVSRFKLAVSQYTALSVLVLFSVIIVHIGYVIAGWKLRIMTPDEIAFSWILLYIPLALYSAAIFSLSLTYPAVVTYIVFIAIPYVLIRLTEVGINELACSVSYMPMVFTRFVDNIEFLFPNVGDIILWPRLTPTTRVTDPPFPDWTWLIVHSLFSFVFWILLGFWFYRNYDFGSRTQTK